MSDAPKKKTGKKGAASKKKKGTKDPGPAPSGAAPGPNKDPQPPAIESMARLDSVQRDWVQREWIEHVNLDIKKIVDFLNKFELSTKAKMAELNTKLAHLERQMVRLRDLCQRKEFLEAQIETTQPFMGGH